MTLQYSGWSDKEVWEAFKAGSRDAYAFIYEQYVRVLYSYGRQISSDTQLVEDCIQELFIYLDQHREQLGSTNSIKYYLFKSLRRRIVDVLVHKSKYQSEDIEEAHCFEMIASHESMLVLDQLEQEQKQRLTKALNTLSKRQREAIYLSFYDNLSHKEIASVMSLEIKTVYNLIYNSITTLRKSLIDFYTFFLLLLGYLIG